MVFDTLNILADWNRWQCEFCGLKFESPSKIATTSEKSVPLLGHINTKHVKHLETEFNLPFNQIDDKDKLRKTYSGEVIHVNPLEKKLETH